MPCIMPAALISNAVLRNYWAKAISTDWGFWHKQGGCAAHGTRKGIFWPKCLKKWAWKEQRKRILFVVCAAMMRSLAPFSWWQKLLYLQEPLSQNSDRHCCRWSSCFAAWWSWIFHNFSKSADQFRCSNNTLKWLLSKQKPASPCNVRCKMLECRRMEGFDWRQACENILARTDPHPCTCYQARRWRIWTWWGYLIFFTLQIDNCHISCKWV